MNTTSTRKQRRGRKSSGKIFALKTQYISLPIQLRKSKDEKLRLSPESAALVLTNTDPNEGGKNGKCRSTTSKKKLKKQKTKMLRVLFDSGATANTVCARYVIRHARKKIGHSVKRITANGNFKTNEIVS